MKEGSIFLVIDFPVNWPPPFKKIMFQEIVKGSHISILVNEEGQIETQIDSETFISQTIIFTLAKRGILSIFWNFNKEPKIECFINSILLNTTECKEILYVRSNPELNDPTPSFNYQEASNQCKEWIVWRSERYGALKPNTKKSRMIKSLNQQIQDLNDSLYSLRHYISYFQDKERIFLINTLPHLRSLLFWPDGKAKNYNPLLFRVAGYFRLGLPIFAFKDRIKGTIDNPLFSNSLFHRVNNYPSITKQNPNQELMDFQEWLNMEVVVDRSENYQHIYRWKDILFESANTVSAAHFDDDVPVFIDTLKGCFVWDNSLFYTYIMTITQTTLTLGDYVISKAKETI